MAAFRILAWIFWLVVLPVAMVLAVLNRAWDWLDAFIAWLKQKKPTTHGDADWATKKQLKQNGNLDPHGFYMCRVANRPVFSHRERSAIMMAAPGTGKSQTIIAGIHALKLLPAHERPTLIISDAANEVYTWTRKLLDELGYSVGKIDLQEPGMSAKYDVLSYIRPTHVGIDVEDVVDALVAPDPKEIQRHFRDFARKMLKDAITLNVKYEGNTKTIDEIVSEIIDEEGREGLIERMKKYGPEFAAIKTFEKLGKNEGPSMLSTSLNHLEIWKADRIKDVSRNGLMDGETVERGWTWEDVLTHKKPVAIFIRTGLSGAAVGGQFTRVVMLNAVHTVMRMWDRRPVDSKLPCLIRPLRIIADEAADMGRCTAIVKAHNVLRKAGVTIMLCFLSKSAFDATYGDDAPTLWSGCDHLVFGGCKDGPTNLKYSEMAGKRTVLSESRDASGAVRGLTEIGVPLIFPDQIFKMGKYEAFASLGNLVVRDSKPYYRGRNGQHFYL